MKRDMDMVREVLLEIEAAGPEGLSMQGGADPAMQFKLYHIKLLKEAGYIEASLIQGGAIPLAARVLSLTWAGHEFLDAVKNDTVWARTKKTIADKGGGATIEIVKMVAISVAKRYFDLPG